MARSLHTYLRKYCDDDTTTILYQLIAAGRGTSVWFKFVKYIVEFADKNDRFERALEKADYADLTDIDEQIMRKLIECWGKENVDLALEHINDN